MAAGEFVDVGVLKLDYKTEGFLVHTGTMHKSVVREGPEALADHKSKLPSSIARLVQRPMTLVGPADIAISNASAGLSCAPGSCTSDRERTSTLFVRTIAGVRSIEDGSDATEAHG